MLSLCFKNPFVSTNFVQYGKDINVQSYLDYLKGQNLSLASMGVDYNNVTIDLNDYVTKYYVQRTNGSYEWNSVGGKSLFYVSFNGFWFDGYYKCYAIDTPPDKSIQGDRKSTRLNSSH